MDQEQPTIISKFPKHKKEDLEIPAIISSSPSIFHLDPDTKGKKEVSDEISRILEQRRDQRDLMLKFLKKMASQSFYLLAGMVIFQGFVRLFHPTFEIVNTTVFNIISVSIFGQVVSVILIVVKSLWDDSKYIDKL